MLLLRDEFTVSMLMKYKQRLMYKNTVFLLSFCSHLRETMNEETIHHPPPQLLFSSDYYH